MSSGHLWGRRAALLASVGASVLLAPPAFAADVHVGNGESQTTTVNVGGTDTVTVDTGGLLATSSGGPGIHWNSNATGGGIVINNAGTLGSEASGPVPGGPGVTFDAEPGIASNVDVTGAITINNSGLMGSPNGPGIVLGQASVDATITNASGGRIAGGGGIQVSGSYIDGGRDIAIVTGLGTNVINNSGEIDGDVLLNGASNTVNIYDGSVINGDLWGGGGTNTLNLNGAGGLLHGTSEAPFAGASDGFDGWNNFETLNVNSGTWTLAGKGEYDAVNVAPGATLYVCASHACAGTLGVAVDDGGIGPLTQPTLALVNNGVLINDQESTDIRYTPGDTPNVAISGAGTFVFKGGGTTYIPPAEDLTHLTGTVNLQDATMIVSSTLGGNVLINPGSTLQIGTGGTLTNVDGVVLDNGLTGDVLGSITDNGVLIFDRVDNYTFGGALSGNGSLVKMGSGVLTLSGAYTYTGATTVLGGSIDVLSQLPSTTTVVVDSGDITVSGGQVVSGLSGTGGKVDVTSGALTVQQTTDTTYAGAITGAGSIVLTGSGTLTLSGANTYAGSTTVNSGTLNVTGSLPATTDLTVTSGVVALNGGNQTVAQLAGAGGAVQVGGGTLVVAQTGDSTYAGSITGPGALTLAGSGTLTLAGANSYAGPTTVNSGTLNVTGSLPATTQLSVAGGVVALNGGDQTVAQLAGAGGAVQVGGRTLVVAQTGDSTYAGSITGPGALTLAGSGTLTLAGANSYAGPTTVTAGTLNVTGSLPATTQLTVAGGVVALNGGSQTVAQLSGAGGAVQIGGGALTVDQTATTVYAGAITGDGGLTLAGGGVLNLTGDNSYTGPTTVDGGLLKVNGAIVSDVVIASGGSLGGSGRVGGSISIGAGGAISPGNSPGILTVAGDLTFGAGSTYVAQVQPGASPDHDQIKVTGAGHVATIVDGAAVQVQPAGVAGDYGRINSYAILTADGGVSGSFDSHLSITGDLPLKPYLVYSAHEVDLVLLRTDITFASLASTSNQAAVANAVEAGGFGTALFDQLVTLDAPESRAAYDALSGELYASVPTAMIEQSRYVRQSLLGRLGQPEGGGAWGKYLGGWARGGATADTGAVRSDLQGFILGVDHAAGPDWRVGAAGAYTVSQVHVASRDSHARVETVELSAYAGGDLGPVAARVEASYGWHDVHASRTVDFTGFADATRASYDAHSAEIVGEIGRALRLGAATVEPYADLGYQRLSTDAFQEAGGDAALAVAGRSRDITFAAGGVRISDPVALSRSLTLTPHVSAAWRGAWGDVDGRAFEAFQSSGQAFSVAGARLGRSEAVVDAGVDLSGRRGAKLTLTYSGAFSNRWQDHAVKLGAAWTF